MPIAEWENLDLLVSLEGNLALNVEQADGLFVTAKENAESGTEVRVTGQGVPQGFGSILHKGFTDGYVVKMPIQYWVDARTPACATTSPTAQQMDDLLMRHVRSLFDGGGRILYTPNGMEQRLLDSLRVFAKPTLVEDSGLTGTTIVLASEFPYMQDFNQTLTEFTASATLTNTGSSPYLPVFKVFGPFSTFTLANTTTGKKIVYDDGLPGAVAVGSGDYIEINCFHDTVYLNGSGASRKAGIVIEETTFFDLAVGDNFLTIDGGITVDALWAPAWF
jgi:tail protein